MQTTAPTETGPGRDLIRLINESRSLDELMEVLEITGGGEARQRVAQGLLAARASAGGAFRSLEEIVAAPHVGAERVSEILDVARRGRPVRPPEQDEDRIGFRSRILENPNYFGNLDLSPYKPVKLIQGNTTWEELVCVGLYPTISRLEAVIHIKQASGYGGDVCSDGSFEYVRFFVDINDNGVWHDVGLSWAHVYNIPGQKPLCYAVLRHFDDVRKLCSVENIVRVRAILSYNVPPPAGVPGFSPVYGNVLTAQVQIHPRKFIIVDDFLKAFELAKVPIPDPIGPVIAGLDPKAPIQLSSPQPLPLAQLKQHYLDKGVPVHRFAYPAVQKALSTNTSLAALFAPGAQSPLEKIGLVTSEIADVLGKLQLVTDGDTGYEELRCIGLRQTGDILEGVITIKKPFGYGGGLCGDGSTEYVAWWIDFDDGNGFTYMGTSTLKVHDLTTIPDEDVQYAVYRDTDLTDWRLPCDLGARVVRLRAILSWSVAPPPGNPNWVPVWGNREECLIQLQPGSPLGHEPEIETVGDIWVSQIDPSTGLADGDLEFASGAVTEAPFGGEVTITGRIHKPPDAFFGPALEFKYRILIRKDTELDFHPLLNQITVGVSSEPDGLICPNEPCPVVLTPTDDGDGFGPGWYRYLKDETGIERNLVVNTLARWQTTQADEGMWSIKMEAKDPATNTLFTSAQIVRVRIDNTSPSAPPLPLPPPMELCRVRITLDQFTFNGETNPAVPCGEYPVGSILEGTYEAHDPGTADLVNQHFGGVSLDVIPDGPANGAAVEIYEAGSVPLVAPFPSSRAYPTVPTTGESGKWRLNTSGMDPCGYVVRLVASDRTNVGSGALIGFQEVCDLGFCLQESV